MSAMWNKRLLGEFFRIKHGYAFKGKHFTTCGDMVVLTPGNFRPEGGLKLKGEKEKYYDGKFPEEFLLERGDFLVAMTDLTQDAPILGSPLVVPESGTYLHNQRLGKIIDLDRDQIDDSFLFYLFNSSDVRSQIKGSATGATVRHTAPDRIYKVEAPIPDLPTQRRIADILSAYDELIENNLRRIKILEAMAQSLYREWFVHFRYPSHESVPLVESPLGPIPEGWEAGTLGDLVEQGHASLQTGPFGTQLKASDYSDEGTPVINVRNIGFGTLRPEKLEFLAPEKADTHRRHMLQEGDIVFGRKGAVERHLLIGPGEDGWIQGSDCIRLRVTSGPVPPRLLSVGFREESHQRWMMNQCSSGATMASLNQDILCRIPLVVPPPALVSRFDAFATAALDHVDQLALKNQKLRQTRDLLLLKILST